MERGEIWWAALPRPIGSEPGYRRPVLVVQSDRFNRSRIRTVLVAAVTSNLDRSSVPGNVVIHAADSGLPDDSTVNLTQVVTVNRSRLEARAGRLSRAIMALVDDELRLVLGLG